MENSQPSSFEIQALAADQTALRCQYQEKYADAFNRYNEAYAVMREAEDEAALAARRCEAQDAVTSLYLQVLAENQGTDISNLHRFIADAFGIDESLIRASYSQLEYMRRVQLTTDRRVVLGLNPEGGQSLNRPSPQ